MSCASAALSSILFLAGCALEVTSEEEELLRDQEEAADVEVAIAAIQNGTLDYTQRGVVELLITDDIGPDEACTGALLNQHWMITAAHCVSPLPNWTKSGTIEASVSYFDPDTGGKRKISTDTKMFVVISPLAQCIFDECEDPGGDVALIRNGKSSPKPWEGAASNWPDWFTKLETKDFLRINGTSSTSAPLAPLFHNDYYLTAYGRGPGADNGAGYGVLRRMEGFVESYPAAEIRMVVSTQATCHGDSGGPYIGDYAGNRIIAGVQTMADDFSGACADAHELQYAARIDRHTKWIKDTIGACTSYSGQYTRCW